MTISEIGAGGVRRWSLRHLPVLWKVLAAVAVGAAAALLVGWVALVKLGDVNEVGGGIYQRNLVPSRQLAEIDGTVNELRATLLRHAVTRSDADMRQREEELAAFRDKIDSLWADYAATSANSSEQQTRQQFNAALEEFYGVAFDQFIPVSRRSDVNRIAAIEEGPLDSAFDEVSDALAPMERMETEQAATAAAASQRTYEGARTLLMIVIVVGTLVAAVLGLLVARVIRGPLHAMVAALRRVEGGDLTVTVPIRANDEVGQLGHALNASTAAMAGVVRSVVENAQTLAAASKQLTETATAIGAAAEETAAQAGTVSAASEEVSQTVQTVAAGGDEMSASIREIAHNASQAAHVATDAVTATQTTGATVAKLAESSREIGEVVKVITSIAEQTNLLALNATIEAARAGDAGKGFAVVATEVKDLAQETARATEDIARRVAAIQSDTTGVTTAMEEIAGVIEQINEYQVTISTAVEEQSTTTSEIGRSVNEVATATSNIATNITSVATAARDTTAGVAHAQQAAGHLTRMSDELRDLVGRFRV